MTTANEVNIPKANDIICKTPMYFSPDSNKKNNFFKLSLASKNMYQYSDSNMSKNQIKKKVNSNLGKDIIINFQQQNKFLKGNKKLLIETPIKFNKNLNSNNNKSYKKFNSKLYLKKNVTQNISSLNETNGKELSTQSNFYSNTNINNTPKVKNNNFEKSSLSNIKFNIGKSSQNLLNSKNPPIHLKKNAGSAIELTEAKTKNLSALNNINPLEYIYTARNKQNKFLSPNGRGSNPKIIFFKDENNKTKEKFYKLNRNESKANQNQIKENEQNNADSDKANANHEEDKKNQINLLLKNTFTNVKIFPTTILNNKIIYNNSSEKSNQNKNKEQNQQNKKNENSINTINNSKIKKEKIVIETIDKKPSINKSETFKSIEELHYFYVDTLQKGKKIANELDKYNN